VFDNEIVHEGNCKRLYMLGRDDSRAAARRMVEEAVATKQRIGIGNSGGGSFRGDSGGYRGGGGGGRARSRSPPRGRSRSRDRRSRDRDYDRRRY
jgi:hypothetical protein